MNNFKLEAPILDKKNSLTLINPQRDCFCQTRSAQCHGLESQQIIIEVHCSQGLKQLQIGGLPSNILKDSKEKLGSLLNRYGWGQTDRLLVNILPPELPKLGAQHELAVMLACIGCLIKTKATGFSEKLKKHVFVGSIALSGDLVSTPSSTILEQENPQKYLGPGRFKNLDETLEYLMDTNATLNENLSIKAPINEKIPFVPEVEGRTWERFILLASMITRRPTLLIGAPGLGKSHIASWLSALVPINDDREIDAKIWTLAERKPEFAYPILRPHARSMLSEFIGFNKGGYPRPGMFPLAHNGILILDEFLELNRDVREILRNVLDQKKLSRHTRMGSLEWPADFWLVATTNPCPCGYNTGSDHSRCRCRPTDRLKYQNRLSGPLRERFISVVGFHERDLEIADLNFNFDLLHDSDSLRKAIGRWRSAFTSSTNANPFEKMLFTDRFFNKMSFREKKLKSELALAISIVAGNNNPSQCISLLKNICFLEGSILNHDT